MVNKLTMKCVSVAFDENEKNCIVLMNYQGAAISFRDPSPISNYIVGKWYNVTIEPQNG